MVMAEMAAAKQNIIEAIKTYSKLLFGFIRSRVTSEQDAEDILQDVWYQFSNQSEIDDIESISGWLYRVARNKITDSFRKKKDELIEYYAYEDEDGSLHLPGFMLQDEQSPETEQLKQLFWKELFASLEELPEKQRRVFVLNELEHITLQEIADQQGENLKTIISRKRYAVLHLRNRLESIYHEIINY
jgi:RNA polymerase sigma factor (sigma-70 family)